MDAVAKKTPLYILSSDLRDAFGSIPHELIEKNQNGIGLPNNIIELVMVIGLQLPGSILSPAL
jgi:hypothetical protein